MKPGQEIASTTPLRSLPFALPLPVALVALTLLLAGCSPDLSLESMAGAPETALVDRAVRQVQAGEVAELVAMLTPDVQPTVTPEFLDKLVKEVPPGATTGRRVVGYSLFTVNGARQVTVTLEYPFPTGFLVVQGVVVGPEEALRLRGFHLRRDSKSLEELNAFTLQGKSLFHYAVLAAACGVPLFILATAVVCARTPMKERKWLWLLFVLVGAGSLTLNWTTGDTAWQLIRFQFLGGGILKTGPYSPWVLSVSVPVGAVLFLRRRKQLRLVDPQSEPQLQREDYEVSESARPLDSQQAGG